GYIVFNKVELPHSEGPFQVSHVSTEVDYARELVAGGPIAKFIHMDVLLRMAQKAGLQSGDVLFFAAGKEADAAKPAGAARARFGEELSLIKREQFALAWITDFPMYEWNDEDKKVDFSHNPFSMPQGGLAALEASDPLTIKAHQYDIVCNGFEIASG